MVILLVDALLFRKGKEVVVYRVVDVRVGNEECRDEDVGGEGRGERAAREGLWVGREEGMCGSLYSPMTGSFALRVCWCLGSKCPPVRNLGADPKEWK